MLDMCHILWHDLGYDHDDRRTDEERAGRPPRGPERDPGRRARGPCRGLVVGQDLSGPWWHPERRDAAPQLRRRAVGVLAHAPAQPGVGVWRSVWRRRP